MYQEACRDFRGRMLPGSYPYVGNVPPHLSVSSFMGYLKSSLMIFDKHANLKYK